MKKYFDVLNKNILFRDIKIGDMEKLLDCLQAHTKEYKADQYVFFAGDKLRYIGIILEGQVEIIKESQCGNRCILAFLDEGQMFSEGIVYTQDRLSPVTVKARKKTKLLRIPYEKLYRICNVGCEFHYLLIQNMLIVLGEKNMLLNKKIDLLTLKGMREKIAGFLVNEHNEKEADEFEINLNRTELADYLNVSRTSMSRELSRMKNDSIIDFEGQKFKILDGIRLKQCLR